MLEVLHYCKPFGKKRDNQNSNSLEFFFLLVFRNVPCSVSSSSFSSISEPTILSRKMHFFSFRQLSSYPAELLLVWSYPADAHYDSFIVIRFCTENKIIISPVRHFLVSGYHSLTWEVQRPGPGLCYF